MSALVTGALAINWSRLSVGVATALLGAVAVVLVIHVVMRLASRRWPSLAHLARASRIPFRVRARPG